MNPIEQNALYILKIIVDKDIKRIGGKGLEEETGFDTRDVNDAVEYLEDLDAVDVLRGMGTSPYKFVSIAVKSRGRYLYHEIFSEAKGTIINENEIKPSKVSTKSNGFNFEETKQSDLNNKSLPKRPYNPVGSPYGFTNDNWEEVTRRQRDKNQLYVVFGLQYESEYYETADIIENIKRYFETSIENFKSDHQEETNIKLNFKKLTAGYGGHVFNSIAESIIGSDIAVFEVSDRNPNVMIELGVALTWDRRVLPLRELNSPESPSDISGQHWIKYEQSGEIIHDEDFHDKLNIMVERAILKKGK